MATTFSAHPYRTPVIGWMNDLENMKAEDARDWYQAWYAPNNATLVVVGDVQAPEVFKLARQVLRRHQVAAAAGAQAAGRAGAERRTPPRR